MMANNPQTPLESRPILDPSKHITTPSSIIPSVERTLETLQPSLSQGATVSSDPPSRWSTYKAPKPVAVVKVNSQVDVAATVKFCNDHGMRFLAQNGGNGWAAFQDIQDLVIIDISNLNSVTVASDKKTAVIGGGVRVHEVIAAADAADVVVCTGNCNGVGALGAFLGGGYGNLQGTFGLGVDNILEMRVVTADGELRTISPSEDEELFWAMRGAGPNFGIVTQATVKAYPMSKDERTAFSGALIYTEDKLEQLFQAIQDLELTAQTVCFLYFASGGPPAHTPMIIVTVWQLHGTTESGKEAFKCFFDIGPIVDTTAVVPYTQWNTGADAVCLHSGRKPSFTAGLNQLDPKTWRNVWNEFVEFQKKPTAENSVLLLENYPNSENAPSKTSAAFPHRGVRFNAAVIPWYTDKGLDEEGVRCGKEIRELLRNSNGRGVNSSHVNFAHGDEPLEEIYGDSLPRLRELKKKWDPKNRFNLWFNIQ